MNTHYLDFPSTICGTFVKKKTKEAKKLEQKKKKRTILLFLLSQTEIHRVPACFGTNFAKNFAAKLQENKLVQEIFASLSQKASKFKLQTVISKGDFQFFAQRTFVELYVRVKIQSTIFKLKSSTMV